jgi:hypothetical protein
MSDLETSPLYREVLLITQGGPTDSRFAISATLIVKSTGVKLPVLKVLSIDDNKDYVANYMPEMFIKFMLSAGEFANKVYPFINDLDLTITMYPIGEVSGGNPNGKIVSKTYSAILIDTGDPHFQQTDSRPLTSVELDLSKILDLDFRLVSKTEEMLRGVQVGGIFRRVTTEKVLKAVFSTESAKIKVNNIELIKHVNVVETNNKEVREVINIPQTTPLVNLPMVLQHKCGGLYSADIGYFLHGDGWFVFPLFDTQRYGKEPDCVTIINIPKTKMPGTERTYRKNGDNITLLATGEIRFNNRVQENQAEHGTGVRFVNANDVMGGMGKTSNNETKFSRNEGNNEFVSTKRTDGLNIAMAAKNKIQANQFTELSKLAARNGSIVTLQWENSNLNIIKPGTPVRLVYSDGRKLRTLKGCILKAHEYTQLLGTGMTQSRYGRNTVMTLFIENTHQLS